MNRVQKVFIIILSLFFATNSSTLFAQSEEAPFSSIMATVNFSVAAQNNSLKNFWNSGSGFKLQLESPFYFGVVQIGVISTPFKGKEKEYPDFRENFIYAGLGDEIALPFNFYLYSGFELGHLVMDFQDDNLSEYEKSESEFSAGVNFRLSYELINDLFISASSDLTVVFTKERLKFYYLSGGLSYRIASPKWVEDFFN